MFLDKVIITKNKKLNDQFFHLSFRSTKIARSVSCGQFLFIKINDSYDPLLRRPLSVAWVFGGDINIIYKVVGKGTLSLSTKHEGDQLDIMGPLGKGFTFHKDKKIVLVAGGVGIASLIPLTKMCVQKNVYLFYGTKTKNEFISERFLSLPKKNITYATEDGSMGFKGLITEVFEKNLKTIHEKLFIYACGPSSMLKTMARLAKTYKFEGEANLEERMACGVGACLGCAIETKQGMKMVCKDGPVFSFKELGWR